MTSKTMSKITFTREQKNFLDEFFSNKANEYNEKLHNDEEEEMSLESLVDIVKSIFNTSELKISKTIDAGGKKPRKTKKKRNSLMVLKNQLTVICDELYRRTKLY